MSDKIISDVNGLEPGDLIDLFELDMSTGTAPSTEPIFRWHSGYNENLQEIVWQGNRYSAFPIEASGFEFSGAGSIPRPKLTVANITTLSLSSNLMSNQETYTIYPYKKYRCSKWNVETPFLGIKNVTATFIRVFEP